MYMPTWSASLGSPVFRAVGQLEPKENVLRLARQSCAFSVHKAVGVVFDPP